MIKIVPARLFTPLPARRIAHSSRLGVMAAVLFAGSLLAGATPPGPEMREPPRAAADGLSVFVSESTVPARLFRASLENGALTSVGSTTFVPGLDFSAAGVLYGSSSTLYTISTSTGAAATIGPLPELLVSIAFSPAGDLFGVSNDGRTLYRIDPRSGRSLGSVPLTGTVFTNGAPFVGEINGIDFGPDGKLYGIGFALYTIDPATGVATRITPLGRGALPGSVLLADLDFGSDGQLRTATAVTTETASDLYIINPATGIGQLVGSMGAKISGLASVLEIPAAPTITSQPLDLTVSLGGTASFSAMATGMPSPTYQWRKDGVNIAGATNTFLAVPNVSPAAVGSYSVVVTNASGSATSRSATLIISSGTGRLINLSILTSLARSGETFTVGTVIGGSGTSGPKPVVIRAVGPSLTALGVTGALADPKVDVFSGPTVTASNDNWGGGAALSTAFAQVGAFALAPADSRDAAVFVPTMDAGGYTVQVSGVGGVTGTVIAELYDGTPTAAFTATTPRLVNVSVLKEISAGATLTAGFTVGGTAPAQVLIRAVGPGLTAFGVATAMADPQINVLDANARSVGFNDNWGGGTTLTAAFSAVGAFGFVAGSNDAAVLVTLQPGNYTAQVNGVAGAGGSVLVEVYEVR